MCAILQYSSRSDEIEKYSKVKFELYFGIATKGEVKERLEYTKYKI